MQANRNQTERNRLEWFYAIEWEGVINFEEESFFAGCHKEIVETVRGKGEITIIGGNNRKIFLYIRNRIETGIFKINDAIEIEARENNISTILNDFSIENGVPHLITSNTVVIEPLKNSPDNRRGITIFPVNYLIPPKTVFEIHKRLSRGEELNPFNNYLARKILICVANQTHNKSPALETIRDIAKVIILTENTPMPTEEHTATDAAPGDAVSNTDEPGAAAVVYPDGLKVIKEHKGGALDADFLKEVLPNVQYIRGTETDRPEMWGRTKTKIHRNRDFPWTVFEWEGISYRAWKDEEELPKKRYAVKLEIREQGAPKNRIFDFKNGG